MVDSELMIEELGQARSEMERAIATVDRQQEICPGWTVKEILAHISGWDAVGIRCLQAHLAGEDPPPLEGRSIDEYNAYLVAGCEELTFEETVENWRQSRTHLETALAETTPAKLNDQVRFPWGETGTIAWYVSILVEHEQEHAREIMEIVSGGSGEAAE